MHLSVRCVISLFFLEKQSEIRNTFTFFEIWKVTLAVTCESLVSREFSRIFLKFHLSISVSRYFNFTFTSRKEWNKKSFHFSFLEKSERNICFTFHFSKKVKAFQISLYFSRKKSEIVHVTLDFVMKNSKELVM